MNKTRRAFVIAVLCAVVSEAANAQGATTLLQIDTENNVRYVYDTSEFSAFASLSAPVTRTFPTFATWVTEADIVAVNGKPAKGVYLTRQVAINMSPNPAAGQGIADLVATNIVDRILVLLQPDGTPVGTMVMLGLDGGNPPAGALATARQGNFAITGGTGAFLGMRGQFASGPLVPGAVATRTASVREDPARRRINGGGKAIFLLHLIPMSRPEIVVTASGPAVLHSSDFSLVTAARPARAGETLIAVANGLGPTVPGEDVDPGKPFPVNPPFAAVNSPVDVTVNGQAAAVVNKLGWPGLVDTYRVDFRVPDGTASGSATLQLSAAWIPGSEVRIPVQ